MMTLVENSMYEIGLLIENTFDGERFQSIGQNVYEISLILHEYRNND